MIEAFSKTKCISSCLHADLVAGLRMRSLSPPIVPTIQSHLDTSNFDEYPMDNDGTPPDDVTGWDEKF